MFYLIGIAIIILASGWAMSFFYDLVDSYGKETEEEKEEHRKVRARLEKYGYDLGDTWED